MTVQKKIKIILDYVNIISLSQSVVFQMPSNVSVMKQHLRVQFGAVLTVDNLGTEQTAACVPDTTMSALPAEANCPSSVHPHAFTDVRRPLFRSEAPIQELHSMTNLSLNSNSAGY